MLKCQGLGGCGWGRVDGGSKGGAVVRALASHQCGLGLISGPGVKGFPLSSEKNQHF